MKYLSKKVLFFLLVMFAMASCNPNETAYLPSEEKRPTSVKNLNFVETNEFQFEGITYPEGTIISHNTESRATITLPEKFEFVYVDESGNISAARDICYECTCVGETSGGCDVEWGEGGFGCYHGDRCTGACSGSHVDCDDDSAVSLVGIYDYSKSISFIKENEKYETLNQFIYFSENVIITHRNSLSDINESLFNKEYSLDENEEKEIIAINYFGNLLLIEVSTDWKDYASGDYNSDLYNTQLSTANANEVGNVSCNCVFANPFDVRPGECTLNLFDGLSCISKCVETCRMKIKTGQTN